MSLSHDFGVWVAALLTLFVFSFLYKDNPLYKLAEHLFVGVSAGYYIVLNFWTVVVPNLYDPLVRAFTGHDPVTHEVVANAGGPFAGSVGDYRAWLLFPGLLGVLLITSEYATGLIRTTLAAVPRLGLSADVGYQWYQSPFVGYTLDGMMMTVSAHWYLK